MSANKPALRQFWNWVKRPPWRTIVPGAALILLVLLARAIMLGLPAYDDESIAHHRDVESLDNALLGIHAGLMQYRSLPANYQGVALYSEWQMSPAKWRQ